MNRRGRRRQWQRSREDMTTEVDSIALHLHPHSQHIHIVDPPWRGSLFLHHHQWPYPNIRLFPRRKELNWCRHTSVKPFLYWSHQYSLVLDLLLSIFLFPDLYVFYSLFLLPSVFFYFSHPSCFLPSLYLFRYTAQIMSVRRQRQCFCVLFVCWFFFRLQVGCLFVCLRLLARMCVCSRSKKFRKRGTENVLYCTVHTNSSFTLSPSFVCPGWNQGD